MSETEMAALIKLVWLAEIGILLPGKENRKALHKQRKMALAELKKQPFEMMTWKVWGDISSRTLHTNA